MPERVPVSAISKERLARWLATCEHDHATPLVLVAISHDEHAGDVHVYRTQDGPSDAEIGALLRAIGTRICHAAGHCAPQDGRARLP